MTDPIDQLQQIKRECEEKKDSADPFTRKAARATLKIIALVETSVKHEATASGFYEVAKQLIAGWSTP